MELVVFLVSLFGFLALGIPIAIVLVLCSMVLMYYGGMWDSMFVMIIPQSMPVSYTHLTLPTKLVV